MSLNRILLLSLTSALLFGCSSTYGTGTYPDAGPSDAGTDTGFVPFVHNFLGCTNDVDCADNGTACGTYVCSWGDPAVHYCVPVDSGDPGWCGDPDLDQDAADQTCKCFAQGARCNTGTNFCTSDGVWGVMASVDLDQVQTLRAKTNASLSVCKRVIVQTDGDMEKAVAALKKEGEVIECEGCGGKGTWADPVFQTITRCESCKGTGLVKNVPKVELHPIGRELLETIAKHMSTLPPNSREADPHVVKEINEMDARGFGEYTEQQLYDAIQRIGDREPYCEVSTFVIALCNLKVHYTRPQ